MVSATCRSLIDSELTTHGVRLARDSIGESGVINPNCGVGISSNVAMSAYL
jgi:hypothetical protein